MIFLKSFRLALILFLISISMLCAPRAFSFTVIGSDLPSHKRVLNREALKSGRLSSAYRLPGSGFSSASDFMSRYGQRWHFIWDKITLSPLLASGEGISMLGEGVTLWDVEGISRYFIDENSELFGLSSIDLMLDNSMSRQAGPYGEMWFIHFIQTYQGLPVLNSNVFLRYKFGRLIQFGSESFPDISLDVRPSLSADIALDQGKAAVSFDETMDEVISYGDLAVYPVQVKGRFEYRLVYRNIFLKSSPYGEWTVYVDARDGSVVESFTNTYYFQGRLFAQIHPRLATDGYMQVPLEGVLINLAGYENSLTDGYGVFGARLSGIRQISLNIAGPSAEARRCDTVYLRKGNYTSCDTTETRVVFMGNEDWEWRDDLRFTLDDSNTTAAERDAFFYVNRAVHWASKYINTEWFGKQLAINVNIKEIVEQSLWDEKRSQAACNAFWDGRSINFFQEGTVKKADGTEIGCNNVANIADIVIHEWGHGLDQNTGGIDDPAFSEAIADTCAFMMTGDPHIAPTFFKEPEPGTGKTYIRDVSVDKVYPQDQNPDSHLESLIISGAWWDLRTYLIEAMGEERGSDHAAYLFLNHLFTARKYTDSYHAALAVDDDNGNLADGTPNYSLITEAFRKHGLVQD